MIPERVEVIKQTPCPHKLRSIHLFVVMVWFYARVILDFSEKAAPLHRLKQKVVKYECGEEQQASFKVLKQAMREVSVLQTPETISSRDV